MVSCFKKIGRTLSDQFSVLYQHRYCDQEEFSVGVFSNDSYSGDATNKKHFLFNNFDTKTYLTILPIPIYDCKAIACGSTVYFSGHSEEDYKTLSIVKYSFSTKTLSFLPLLERVIINYKVCSFKQKLFILSEVGSWFYNKDTNKWTSIASIMDDREGSACTVFEGKIVVSGGLRREEVSYRAHQGGRGNFYSSKLLIVLDSIESYDFHENKWTYLPSMLSPRVNHTAVSISNKMFMIGGNSGYFEVFDSITREFTYILAFPNLASSLKLDWQRRVEYLYQIVDIGNKIYFFCKENDKVNVHILDVSNNSFTFKTSMEIEKFDKISCIKVPII